MKVRLERTRSSCDNRVLKNALLSQSTLDPLVSAVCSHLPECLWWGVEGWGRRQDPRLRLEEGGKEGGRDESSLRPLISKCLLLRIDLLLLPTLPPQPRTQTCAHIRRRRAFTPLLRARSHCRIGLQMFSLRELCDGRLPHLFFT